MDSILPELAKLVKESASDPAVVQYYEDLSKRMIWIDAEIDEYALDIEKKIIKWNCEDLLLDNEQKVPIKIFFFSPGGLVSVMYSLYDTIKMSKTPIIGINCGQCYSAAAYTFLACHKRYTLPHSSFMFHQGSVEGMGGEFKQIKSSFADYQTQVKQFCALIKENSNYTMKEITSKIETEWYIYSEEALKKGIVEEIISDFNQILK